jgi:drug/metabolite transporter (DMT)-like permease
MLLPPFVVAIVLLSALLHATWNVAVRAGTDRRRETVLVVAGGGVLGIILVPFLPLPSMASWPYLLASAVLNTIYFCLIAEAYERGELSLAYPLMRGTAPMMAALAAWALIGEVLPAQAWFGIAAICGGIVLLARRHGTSERSTVRLALANAVIIAAYTLNDAIGARVSGSALAYTLWLFPIMAVPAILALHGWRLPQTPTWREARRGIGSAGCVIGSYGIVLYAMTKAPVAPVAAMRETAILFGVTFARLLLNERPGARGWSGALTIAAGAAILKFS